jgi:hypothetical protein
MPTIVKPSLVKPILAAGLFLALSACSKFGGGQDEMAWGKSALERNDRLEVVASDNQAKTFTVRMKDSGQLVVIPLDQVVAGPAGTAGAPAKPATASTAPEAPAEAPAPTSTAPAPDSGQPPAGPIPASTPAPSPSQSVTSTVASSGEPAHSAGRQAASEDSNGQYSSTDEGGASSSSGEVKGPHAESAANAKAGSVLASGPGYSIKASGSKATPQRSSPATASRGTAERLHDPIICQGARLLHIDNRNLEFDGDAITAEDGCEIHITNTHISAKGIGVLARAANVHIKNSEIDGDSGAVDASDGAQVYAESSRFKGLTRHLESSAFHDLGGNVWN